MAMIIQVVPYNPIWPQMFQQEAEQLRKAVGTAIHKIHHIGSTSVHGLAAKPIMDIMIETEELEFLDERAQAFEQLSYEVKGEFGMPRRRYYRKGGDHRTHQIHAFKIGDEHIKRHLAFRDYLRTFPDVAQSYGQLKSRIALNNQNDIERYCDDKDPFIQLHEKKALAWYETTAID